VGATVVVAGVGALVEQVDGMLTTHIEEELLKYMDPGQV